MLRSTRRLYSSEQIILPDVFRPSPAASFPASADANDAESAGGGVSQFERDNYPNVRQRGTERERERISNIV